MTKPKTHQRDLTKLPRALAPLTERPQWAVWRWTQESNGRWQKPPFIATQPDRHASSADRGTWSTYAAALAAVQAGHADGITYMLAADDPFAAVDLDHCRDPDTHSIDIWAQLFLERGRDTYSEVTPSGDGIRIWGLARGATLNRKFTLKVDGKEIMAELFRHTNKPLTITGWTLDPAIREFTNIDRTLDWGMIWGGRRKAAEAPPPSLSGAQTATVPAAVTASMRSSGSSAPAPRLARTGATSFTRSSAITPAAAGQRSRRSAICNSSRVELARSISAKAGSRWRFPAAFANGPTCRRWPAMSSRNGRPNG